MQNKSRFTRQGSLDIEEDSNDNEARMDDDNVEASHTSPIVEFIRNHLAPYSNSLPIRFCCICTILIYI